MADLISKDIFKKYDIRGVYPDEFNEENAREIAKAFGTVLRRKSLKNVVLGRDDRPSSFSVTGEVIKGLRSTGCNVTYIGITVTPAIHFLTFRKEFDAGVNITASHNPKKFNGIKFDLSNAEPFWGDEIQSLYNIVLNKDFKTGSGAFREFELNDDYVNFVSSKFFLKRKIKVVLDCGSGATSEIAPEIFSKIGADLQTIYCDYDSNFPHEVSDPETKIFSDEISQKTLELKGDIGIGFDGDGDRFGVVDEKGKAYSTDEITLLFAKDIISKKGRAKILYDVKSSGVVEDFVKKMGGEPVITRTGRAYFLEEFLNKKADFGGELSGHTYFGDEYFGYDDGIYAACRVLRIMDETKKSLSELMSEFPNPVNTPEIKVKCPDNKKFDVIEKITQQIRSENQKTQKFINIIDIDGVRVKVSDTGWFLIRASNTSPYLSVRAEGKDNTEVEQLLDIVSKYLAGFDFLDLKEFGPGF